MANSFSTKMRQMMMSNRFFDMDDMEDRITEMPGVHRWTDDSPVRFEIMKEGLKRGTGGPGGSRSLSIMGSTVLGIKVAQVIVQEPQPAENRSASGIVRRFGNPSPGPWR